MRRRIKFYRTASGQCPVEEFLDSLTGKQAQKVAWVLELIEELTPVPTKFFKKLTGTDDLWEIRADVGGDAFRLLAFLDSEEVVMLTQGLRKKTQKIPKAQISLAQERKKDYLRRKESE